MNANEYGYFVSFSIPEKELVFLIEEAERHQIPVYLNGLVHDDMQATVKAMLYLVNKYNINGVLIDPVRFSYYQISAVPALVKKCGHQFDVIYGDINLKQGLSMIEREGDCKNERK
ncbi:type-F conjugative transfer system pilin assembly protein TrbC [Testudinibacter sp. TR-2022]|nr:type-F conjugative transfer system pilin assembly protein TrbC [Pasteurellaceae bacterium Phil31]TNH10180.1 type-F conjugative transfer system pilin assembly protein TrbC [Testudinibacter sp. TR-2022]TNH13041.1 type-F conjugative transfer system pilin assembly protein TrbC [Testudinibacter sp. TR-2022]